MSFTAFVFLVAVMITVIVRTRSAHYTEISNITSIPQEVSPGDPELIIQGNTITRIPAEAFISYSNLKFLAFYGVPLYYIEEGAFRGQDKLQILRIVYTGRTLLFPPHLGPPTKSLIRISLWGAVPSTTTMAYPYFAAFEQLTFFNIGLNYLNISNADLLPNNITTFHAPYNEISIFPNVGTYAPLIQEISFHSCGMLDLPVGSVTGLTEVKLLLLYNNKLSNFPDITFMKVLENLQLHTNRLSSMPDLYELPLTTLTLEDNPLVCGKDLCWIRMWPWMKASTIPNDEPTCAGPAAMDGMRLMDVDPALMECFRGGFLRNISQHLSFTDVMLLS